MQLTAQDYWDLIDETLDLLQDSADEWQQLIWHSMRQASVVDPDEDFPSIDEWTDGIRDEIEDSSRLLIQELKSLRRRYKAKLINDGEAEFSVKWEDD